MGTRNITGLVKSSSRVVPEIYAYTTPEIARHDGWTKIGYTEQAVDVRIGQQTHTADVEWKLEWHGNAVYDDGSGDTFRDTDFHGYLRKLDYEDKPGTEWFEITPSDSHARFYEYRENRGVLDTPEASEYMLRSEQERAVEETADYAHLHEEGEYLWNAKPRFGKTLAAYDLCKRLDAVEVLIVTNRPAIANSWYDDYVEFIGTESGYSFVSSVIALADKPFVMTREEYLEHITRPGASKRIMEFVSLQDLKGSIRFGGIYDKLDEVAELEWDVLVVDEAHEGVDTYKTDVAFDHIRRKFTLHLSGTPFKAIASEKFDEGAIFNWSYADEQKAKRDWNDPELPNPYADLPQLNLFTYQMSDIVMNEVTCGKEIDGETVEYAFDLNEFFATSDNGHFEHNEDVDKFLDALTTQKKYPFSTPELRGELKHTLWMLSRVDSARALAKKLSNHPVFSEYEIVLAAGDGRIEDVDAAEKSFDKVREAIRDHDKTITLSVGQLTTGVTIPEWTAVLMLSNMKSPSLYMQAAFRSQNPCLFCEGGRYLRKENAYVFDFDPARTLTIFEEFANDLCSDTASGRGDTDARKDHIRTLLNFFPVIGEDEQGEMVELDAERVLSIPRKIRSQEVVRRGFMSDFLFQNISNVFHAPSEVLEIIQRLEPCKEPDRELGIDEHTADDLGLNKNGEVEIPEEQIIGKAANLFGGKVYEDVSKDLGHQIEEITRNYVDENDDSELLGQLEEAFVTSVSAPLVEAAAQNYCDDLRPSQRRRIVRKLKADAGMALNRQVSSYSIQKRMIEKSREEALSQAETDREMELINREHDARRGTAYQELVTTLGSSRDDLVRSAGEDIVREVETGKKERKKQNIEKGVRGHLRGFSRTIPSFLMAYGDSGTMLAVFDAVIPEDVFLEVTSITTDQFRFLRDGGDYTDQETRETRHFDGHLFDPVVFDDSVREFIRLRTKLANYFDEANEEDIFDYVPPQRTNQIYTPRRVVKKMVDLLEKENPGCFDDPSHTFADLYMKSGLYIAEIIRRLYNSKKIGELFPDDLERLRHILEKQVFGIAPTEIIYQIATHFILGYNNEIGTGFQTNFVMADSAKLAIEDRLAEFVEEEFGGKLEG